jgi:hypothetical protein
LCKNFVNLACGEHPEDGVWREFRLEAGEQSSFEVPAKINLRIHLRVLGGIEWAPVTICKNVRLEQGEKFDAGKVMIGEPFAVFVAVSNSLGEPVEGIPVTVCGNWDPVISSSDENGVALIEFVGYSTGDFIVEHKPEDSSLRALRETIPYEINGVEDANSIYEFRVSDRMAYELLK